MDFVLFYDGTPTLRIDSKLQRWAPTRCTELWGPYKWPKINGVSVIISPRNKWSDMGDPTYNLVFRGTPCIIYL